MHVIVEPLPTGVIQNARPAVWSSATEYRFATIDPFSLGSGATSATLTNRTSSPTDTAPTSLSTTKPTSSSSHSNAIAGSPTWADDETDEEDMAVIPRLALEDMEDELVWRREMMAELMGNTSLSDRARGTGKKQQPSNRVTKPTRGRGGRGKAKVTTAKNASDAADSNAAIEQWVKELGEHVGWKQRLMKWEGEDKWWVRDTRVVEVVESGGKGDGNGNGNGNGDNGKDKDG
jgi:hypothetical protein